MALGDIGRRTPRRSSCLPWQGMDRLANDLGRARLLAIDADGFSAVPV
jgi:hypothetical protein